MRCRGERGQAAIVVAVLLSIFLLGAVGLAVDAGNLYFHRQMAQAAADAAAISAMMSMFQGTNIEGKPGYFPVGGGFTCDAYPSSIPCKYVTYHQFAADEHIKVEFPSGNSQVRVIVSRDVPLSFIRLIGVGPNQEVAATATAAVVQEKNPIPIVVLHPNKKQALTMNGTGAEIRICGGPLRSI